MNTEEQATAFYSAVVVFENSSPAPGHPTLYEEEVILMTAESEEEAQAKAISYAKASEFCYKNGYDETITVSFKLLLEVQSLSGELEDLNTGVAVYGRFFRDYDAYEAFEPLLKGQKL